MNHSQESAAAGWEPGVRRDCAILSASGANGHFEVAQAISRHPYDTAGAKIKKLIARRLLLLRGWFVAIAMSAVTAFDGSEEISPPSAW